MASLPQYDGYAEDLIPYDHYKDYYYPNNRASILWYHDHAVHHTSRNAYMGLAGMYIVEYPPEDFASGVDSLPSGEFEIPLIIQDKSFRATSNPGEWELVFNDRRTQGVYADVVLVNGVPFPHLKVKRRKYFFRVLNASTSRTYQLTLSQSETSQVIGNEAYQLIVVGSDGGLLSEPVPLIAPNPIRIGVAERYGVVINFSKFPNDVKQVYLRNITFPTNLGTEAPAILRFDLSDEAVSDDSEIPTPLGVTLDRQKFIDQAKPTQTFRFGRGRDWTINGKTWAISRVDAKPNFGDIELWTLVNTGGWSHPVHIHLVDFRVVDRNGRPPLPYERGWKDVVVLAPQVPFSLKTSCIFIEARMI